MGAPQEDSTFYVEFVLLIKFYANIFLFTADMFLFPLLFCATKPFVWFFTVTIQREINNLRTVRIFTLTFIALYFRDKKKLIQYGHQAFEHKRKFMFHNKTLHFVMSGFCVSQIEIKPNLR